MGNSYQLPNGNQLVCVATSGLIYEVDPAGTTIWSKQLTGAAPQSFRYDTCYANNLAPAIPVISSVGANVLTAPIADTYQWYLNGDMLTGETNQTITCTQNGIYLVRITQAPSCSFSYSTGYNFTLTGISSNDNLIKGVCFFPNPATDVIKVGGLEKVNDNYTVNMFNLEGRLLFTAVNIQEIPTLNLANGCYLISLITDAGQAVNQRIIIAN
jgi:hypothetical protein